MVTAGDREDPRIARLRAWMGPSFVYARDQRARVVPLPALVERPHPAKPPRWDTTLAAMTGQDRVRVARSWWEVLDGDEYELEVSIRSDSGWRGQRIRYLNLLDDPELGVVLVAVDDLGPVDEPDDVDPDDEPEWERPVWMVQYLDDVGLIMRSEGMAEEIYGIPERELAGRSIVELIDPEFHDAALAMWLDVLGTPGAARSLLFRVARPDGAERWLETTVTNRLAEPRVEAMVAIGQDVTRRRQQEAAVRAREQQFRTLAEEVPIGVFRADAAGRITYANSRWDELAAASGAVTELFELAGDTSRDQLHQQFARVLQPGGPSSFDIPIGSADGERVLRVTCRALREPDTEVVFIGTLDDVTDAAADAAALRRRADHDALTGLPNRQVAEERLAGLVAAADENLVVLFIDLDHFRQVNDEHGHAGGDEVLRVVARRLAGAVRPGDLVARHGGDEFVVLCEQVPDGEEACIIERIRRAFANDVVTDELRWTPAMSIGSARALPGDSLEDPIRRADAAMYREKRRHHGEADD